MPKIHHVAEISPSQSFRAAKVAGMFDVPVTDKLRKEWKIDIPIEAREWQVGLIVGASGTGKSTIAQQLFGNAFHAGFEWNAACLLDDFPESADTSHITEILSKVGFSSPPQWLLPYAALSTGQKFRVELARCLLHYPDLIVFDEFTSVVDRQVAQVGTYAFQKAVRKSGKKFVAVTCHYDVAEWLQPDWILDMSTGKFEWVSLRRPQIELEIYRCTNEAWSLFKDYHYLSADLSSSAFCWVACVAGRPVAFSAWLPFFGRLKGRKQGMRVHRAVCLPDFQGLGIGNMLTTEIARMWTALGKRVFLGTSHPAEVRRRVNSPDWCLIRKPGRTAIDYSKRTASNRLTCSFEFTGSGLPMDEALRLKGDHANA